MDHSLAHQPAVLKVADEAYRLQNGRAVPVAEADLTERSETKAFETDSDPKIKLTANPTNLK